MASIPWEELAQSAAGARIPVPFGCYGSLQVSPYCKGFDRRERSGEQQEEIRRLNQGFTDFRLLAGIEVEILPDGSLGL